MACEHSFICGNEISILGITLQGVGWYILMLSIALALQIAANFVWVQNAQTTRELMKYEPDKRGSYYVKSLIWTGISTVISITRIVLIGGNNLGVYLTILVGNLIGTYWAQSWQHKDKYCLSNDLLLMLSKVDNTKCSHSIRGNIDQVLNKLTTEVQKRMKIPMLEVYKDEVKYPIKFN